MPNLAVLQERAQNSLALGACVDSAMKSLQSAETAALALNATEPYIAAIRRMRKDLMKLSAYADRTITRAARKTDKVTPPQGNQ